MMGVIFNRAMRPYGRGDTAWLPDDVARKIIADGDARAHRLPQAPHGADMPKLVTKEAKPR